MEFRSSWWTFAGVMLLVSGFLNAFDGLVTVTQTRYIERNIAGELPITNDVKTWGWIALLLGVLIVLTGLGVLAGATWARMVGIGLASVNLIFQFGYLGHYPFWSFTMIVVDILIIYGLAGHSTEERTERV